MKSKEPPIPSIHLRLSYLSLIVTLAISTSACNDQVNAESIKNDRTIQAKQFIQSAEASLAKLSIEQNCAEWIYRNFITEDAAALSDSITERQTATSIKLATKTAEFANLTLDEVSQRKLNILRRSLALP